MSDEIYVARTGKIKMYICASSIRDAWRRFFKSLKKSDIPHVGHIVELTLPDGEKYLMRTVPALFMRGLIDHNTAIRAIMKVTDLDRKCAEILLRKCCLKDSWVVSDGEDREAEKTLRRDNKL